MNRLSLLAIRVLLPVGLAFPASALQETSLPRQRRIGAPDSPRAEGFGSASTSIGDLDGNGISDLAVGSPTRGLSGSVSILFLDTDGSLLRRTEIEPGQGELKATLGEGARFGTSLAWLGGNPKKDQAQLVVGAPGAGVVWVLNLDSGARVKAQRELSSSQSKEIGPPGANQESLIRAGYGWSLAAPGDLNGDGFDDLVVGAPFDDDGGKQRGALWILNLGPRGQVLSREKISSTKGFFGGALQDLDQFGYALTNVGDLDGDGRSELAVGAPGSRGLSHEAFLSRGAVWILFLGRQAGVRHSKRIDVPVQGDPLAGEQASIRFGSSLTSIGDFDSDGTLDLAVGAPLAGARQEGQVWLLLMRSDGSVLAHQELGEQDPEFAQSLRQQSGFGGSLARLDDLDQNGRADLVVATGWGKGAIWNIILESCFCASVSIREGKGLNPRILTTAELPRRGNLWTVTLDCSTDSIGVAAIMGQTQPASGIFTESGEILVDLSPSCFGFLLHRSHQGELLNFSLSIPIDLASCNMALYVQGACSSKRGTRFSNALDLIIGR